jgi:hypothetical protein
MAFEDLRLHFHGRKAPGQKPTGRICAFCGCRLDIYSGQVFHASPDGFFYVAPSGMFIRERECIRPLDLDIPTAQTAPAELWDD